MEKLNLITLLEKGENKKLNDEVININSLLFLKKFQEIVGLYCKNNVSYTFYMNLYNKALDDARSDNLKSAARNINKAKSYVDLSHFDDIEAKVFNLLTFTIDAYLLYKKKDYISSIEKTFEVMELDNLFEENFPFIYFHKIQQLHNLSRVYYKCGDFKNFTEIIDILFQNLLFNFKVDYSQQKFDEKDINLDLELRILMTHQVFYETIYILENNAKDEYFYFKECFKTVIDNIDLVCFEEFRGILLWVDLKNDILTDKNISEQSIVNYLKYANVFSSHIPTLSIIRNLNANIVKHN